MTSPEKKNNEWSQATPIDTAHVQPVLGEAERHGVSEVPTDEARRIWREIALSFIVGGPVNLLPDYERMDRLRKLLRAERADLDKLRGATADSAVRARAEALEYIEKDMGIRLSTAPLVAPLLNDRRGQIERLVVRVLRDEGVLPPTLAQRAVEVLLAYFPSAYESIARESIRKAVERAIRATGPRDSD